MQAQGLTAEDFADDASAQVWPENWPSWCLFRELAGQWRVSVNGAYALDYGVLFARMERLRLCDAEWECRFADFRALEAAALAQMKKT